MINALSSTCQPPLRVPLQGALVLLNLKELLLTWTRVGGVILTTIAIGFSRDPIPGPKQAKGRASALARSTGARAVTVIYAGWFLDMG